MSYLDVGDEITVRAGGKPYRATVLAEPSAVTGDDDKLAMAVEFARPYPLGEPLGVLLFLHGRWTLSLLAIVVKIEPARSGTVTE